MANLKLIDQVRVVVDSFLTNNKEIFFNERDFQMHLACALKDSRQYDDVDLEYFVPREENDGYPWDSEIRMDIVVRKGDEFLPIELKYKTKTAPFKLSRFGGAQTYTCVLKNQGAQDLGCYDFWKDVKRLEFARSRFSSVKSGLAVFVSNDPFYWSSKTRETSSYVNFSMTEGKHSKEKKWQTKANNQGPAIAEQRPNFIVEQEYSINWKDTGMEGFRFCVVTV